MEVRRAVRADLLGVGRVIHAACWETYTGLLKPSTISEVLETVYAPAELKRRLLEGSLFVAVDERAVIVGFAIVDARADAVEVVAVAVEPDFRAHGVGRALLRLVMGIATGRPVSMNILLGSMDGERFAEALDFVPGEIIERELCGEPVVERRWWHSPEGTSAAGR